MDDAEDDTKYPSSAYAGNHMQGYGLLSRQKLPVRNVAYSRAVDNQYVDVNVKEEEDDEDDDDGDEEMVQQDVINNQNNGVKHVEKDLSDEEDDDDDDDEEGDDDEENNQKNCDGGVDDFEIEQHRKKRKLKSLASSYEFARRVPPPPVAGTSAPKPSFTGRNPLTDWTEHETFVLLDAWGDKFLQRGRKSLRSDEWQQVAEKVSEDSKIERTDTQCRNRLDTLKKKYKKEKLKIAETDGSASKWVYFRKMDMLMSTSAQQGGLSCGLDSGEYVFMNTKTYLNRANSLDEMRDSPGNSESAERNDDSDGLPPKKRKIRRERNKGSSFKLLADSIQKFSDIYEKIEKNKRQQMLELEKMRMDFQRDLEMQKRKILERAHAEIAKIHQIDEEENNISADNTSG